MCVIGNMIMLTLSRERRQTVFSIRTALRRSAKAIAAAPRNSQTDEADS